MGQQCIVLDMHVSALARVRDLTVQNCTVPQRLPSAWVQHNLEQLPFGHWWLGTLLAMRIQPSTFAAAARKRFWEFLGCGSFVFWFGSFSGL